MTQYYGVSLTGLILFSTLIFGVVVYMFHGAGEEKAAGPISLEEELAAQQSEEGELIDVCTGQLKTQSTADASSSSGSSSALSQRPQFSIQCWQPRSQPVVRWGFDPLCDRGLCGVLVLHVMS